MTRRILTLAAAAAALLVGAGSLGAGSLGAQPAAPRPDTARTRPTIDLPTVDLATFVRRVAAHHPTTRQARLLVDQARAELRVARGAFDPTLGASWERKTLGATEYYDYTTAALTLPTPLGVDVKLAYERADGRYASPDRRTPSGGLVTAGLSIPLGQRVLTDERRTALAVARTLRDVADAERDALVNRVLLQAVRDYARWYEGTRRADVARDGVALAEFRLAAVRRRVAAGEAAPLDTIEASLEARRRQVQLVEAEQAVFAARIAAEVHLWDERGLPDSLPAAAAPSDALPPSAAPTEGALAELIAASTRAHPDVLRAEARVEQAVAQQRLAAQQQIPFAAAEVAALAPVQGAESALVPAAGAASDMKLALTARTPLLFLRERGRADLASTRVDQLRLDRDRARREVAAAARTAANDVDGVARSIAAQRSAVDQAQLLLRGEQLRFEAGESTLFLVNARERVVLDERLRLASLEARALTARAELAMGVGRFW
jgi:outer membrane protein TolC